MLDISETFARRTTGTPVKLALGTMNFGKRTPAADGERIIHRALERGITVFDTANAYCDGASEEILGRALKGKRDRAIVATKVGFGRVGGKPEGLAPERVAAALDESLRRLQIDVVDVYYLHVPDPATPIEATLEAIGRAMTAGKVRAFGVSNYASWQILEIFNACDAAKMPRPVVAQQLYNLLIRQLDLEYFRFATKYALHTTVYNPLAGGLLTGRYAPSASIQKGTRFDKNRLYQGRYWSERMLGFAAELADVAGAEGMSPVDLAYAWLGGRPEVDSILLGPASLEHLDDALGAVTKTVTPEGREKIEKLYAGFTGTETSYAR
ncbi:MAG: aldo/keto reductase [Polyangiaceae bacterium]|nr:aldo/keto reductase [Polyangiaceae bacterium]